MHFHQTQLKHNRKWDVRAMCLDVCLQWNKTEIQFTMSIRHDLSVWIKCSAFIWYKIIPTTTYIIQMYSYKVCSISKLCLYCHVVCNLHMPTLRFYNVVRFIHIFRCVSVHRLYTVQCTRIEFPYMESQRLLLLVILMNE